MRWCWRERFADQGGGVSPEISELINLVGVCIQVLVRLVRLVRLHVVSVVDTTSRYYL